MKKIRPLTESRTVYAKKKDATGRTPFTTYHRVGNKITVLHGHLLDSPEDLEAQRAINESCQAAHDEMLSSHADTINELFKNPRRLTACVA